MATMAELPTEESLARLAEIAAVMSASRNQPAAMSMGLGGFPAAAAYNLPMFAGGMGFPMAEALAAASLKRKSPVSPTEELKSQLDGPAGKKQKRSGDVEDVRFREYQAEIWTEKFEDLCDFRRIHGHCHVPHSYKENAPLAQWVKRQRYQYKLKLEGKRSTLSDERVKLLDNIGFIWNSHDAVWEERWNELLQYKQVHNDCIVPSNYKANPQLAVWVKRQRRQYKFYKEKKPTSMTQDRIAKLERLGFAWDCRKLPKGNEEGSAGGSSAASFEAPTGIIPSHIATPNAQSAAANMSGVAAVRLAMHGLSRGVPAPAPTSFYNQMASQQLFQNPSDFITFSRQFS